MKKYLISYDLDKPGQDYPRVITELERLGAIKVLYSEWLFLSNSSVVQIRDYLRPFVDANDMLLVVELTGLAAWTSLMVSGEKAKHLLEAA